LHITMLVTRTGLVLTTLVEADNNDDSAVDTAPAHVRPAPAAPDVYRVT